MKKALLLCFACLTLKLALVAQTRTPCNEFEELVRSTYNFKPSKLTELQRTKQSEAMDHLWKFAKARPYEIAPCLRTLLKAGIADPFFVFDGSNLLVTIDPSTEAKQFQVENYARTQLEDVDLRFWISVMAYRGSEGFDTSAAGVNWLSYPRGRYFLPEHGAYLVSHEQAALFLFGSMDEAFATPTLLSIAQNNRHPAREIAVKLLLSQATPESLRGLAKLNRTGLSSGTTSKLRKLLSEPQLLKPREKPRTSRADFVRAFEDLLNANPRSFLSLVEEVPDGEHDVVAVLRTEDIPLVRKVRRNIIRNANPHAAEFYDTFTAILMTMVWQPELVR